MSKHNDIGKIGEQTACNYLLDKGYKILATNVVYNHKELDIIAKKDNKIIFVEVKTRSSLEFELPKEAVTIKKQKNIVSVADAYLQENNIEEESQFDIISVYAKGTPKILEHIEGAFCAVDLI